MAKWPIFSLWALLFLSFFKENGKKKKKEEKEKGRKKKKWKTRKPKERKGKKICSICTHPSKKFSSLIRAGNTWWKLFGCKIPDQPWLKTCYSEVALATAALAGLPCVYFSISPGKFAQGFKVWSCAHALCQPRSRDRLRKPRGDLYSPVSVPAPASLPLTTGEDGHTLPSACLSGEAMRSCWGCLTLWDNFWRLDHDTRL